MASSAPRSLASTDLPPPASPPPPLPLLQTTTGSESSIHESTFLSNRSLASSLALLATPGSPRGKLRESRSQQLPSSPRSPVASAPPAAAPAPNLAPEEPAQQRRPSHFVLTAAEPSREDKERLREVLRLASTQRTASDVQFLLETTRHVKFFQRLKTEQHRSLCRVMNFVESRKGEVVFRQGDEGATFYIVFSGSVEVFIRDGRRRSVENNAPSKPVWSRSTTVNDLIAVRKGLSNTSLSNMTDSMRALAMRRGANLSMTLPAEMEGGPASSRRSSPGRSPGRGSVDDGPDEQDKDLGKHVTSLGSGMSFGEIALIKSEPRSASVVAVEDTEFITIHKSDYERTLRRLQEELVMERVHFLEKCDPFRTWLQNHIFRLSYFFKERVLTAQQQLVTAGELANGVYYVQRGTVRLVVEVEIKSHQALSEARSQLARVHTKKHQIDICTIGAHQAVGDWSVSTKQPEKFTVVADSDAVLYHISRSDYQKRLDSTSMRNAQRVAEMKQQWYEEQVDRVLSIDARWSGDKHVAISRNRATLPSVQGASKRIPSELAKMASVKNVSPSPLSETTRLAQPGRLEALAAPRNPKLNRRHHAELLARLNDDAIKEEKALKRRRRGRRRRRKAKKKKGLPRLVKTTVLVDTNNDDDDDDDDDDGYEDIKDEFGAGWGFEATL